MAKRVVKPVEVPEVSVELISDTSILNVKPDTEAIIEEVIVTEPTIYDKFDKYVRQAQDGYVRDLSYADAMLILRYCEKQLNKSIPFTFSCGTCAYDLIKLFINLK